MHNKKLK